jgi:hypothetical protein
MRGKVYEPPPEPEAFADMHPPGILPRRRYCTFLQFWRRCAKPACRRAHACRDDAATCIILHWGRLSDAGKVWAYAGIAALDLGLTARVAARVADLALLGDIKAVDRLPRYPARRKRWRWVEGQSDDADDGDTQIG